MVAEAPVLDGDERVADILGKLAERDDLALVVAAPSNHAARGVQKGDVASWVIDQEVGRIREGVYPVRNDKPAGEKHPDETDEQCVAHHRTLLFGRRRVRFRWIGFEIDGGGFEPGAISTVRPFGNGRRVAGHTYPSTAAVNRNS